MSNNKYMKCPDEDCRAGFYASDADFRVQAYAEDQSADTQAVEVHVDLTVEMCCPQCGETVSEGSGETVATVEVDGSWEDAA